MERDSLKRVLRHKNTGPVFLTIALIALVAYHFRSPISDEFHQSAHNQTPVPAAQVAPSQPSVNPRAGCPSGQGPTVLITSTKAEPDPEPGETADSVAHRYRVTVEGRIENHFDAAIKVDATNPVKLDLRGLAPAYGHDLRSRMVWPTITGRGSQPWTASGDVDASVVYRPSVTARVNDWSWESTELAHCPT
jgi:hypothetical protein